MNGPSNPIGWCDYTWNPVKGLCPVGCDYCYARRIYKRFHYNPTIRLDIEELKAPRKLKKPARIFVGSTIELFGTWIPDKWICDILQVIKDNPQHTFQFLTKFPSAMSQFSFPKNCWCGTTITRFPSQSELTWYLSKVQVGIHFISFEPLHAPLPESICNFTDIDWFIIGAETGNRKRKIIPNEKWIAGILFHADAWHIPVFMKDNLKPYWDDELRQEFPK